MRNVLLTSRIKRYPGNRRVRPGADDGDLKRVLIDRFAREFIAFGQIELQAVFFAMSL